MIRDPATLEASASTLHRKRPARHDEYLMSSLSLRRVLEPPAYGFERDGKLYVPTRREILREFFSRLNVLRDRRNWLPFWGWLTVGAFVVIMVLFLTRHFNLRYALVGFVYAMVVLGTHGTTYLHRYATHHAFVVRNRAWLFVLRNLVIKVVPEEVYVVSHHVHHKYVEQPGDPYNARAGWLYCFLADVNHQPIRRDLSADEYARVARLIAHTGVHANSHAAYRRWGSICHPAWTALHFGLNWAFWYGAFLLVAGHDFAVALFAMSGVWAVGIRTFNYEGHGRGKDRRRDGVDFNRADLSINQVWPGYVAGEWHNNHHLYPASARSGFLPYQLDLAWLLTRLLHRFGGVSRYHDFKAAFLRDHYRPHLEARANAPALAAAAAQNARTAASPADWQLPPRAR